MTGAFVFDCWVRNMRNQGLKFCGQFHDEVAGNILKTNVAIQEAESIIHRSMAMVNEQLKLNVTMKVDVEWGENYADVH